MSNFDTWSRLEGRLGITNESVKRSFRQVERYFGSFVLTDEDAEGFNDFQFKSGGRFFPEHHGLQEVLGLTGFSEIDDNCEQPLAYILLSLALDHNNVLDTRTSDAWRGDTSTKKLIADHMSVLLRGVIGQNYGTELALTEDEHAKVIEAIANFRDHGSFDPVPEVAKASGL